MPDLRVSLLQQVLAWEDPVRNHEHFARELARLAGHTDLVILPEMFSTGFSMAAEKIAETNAEHTLPWLREQAATLDAAICGSIAVREAGAIHNRLLFVTPDGHTEHYDKRHCFRISGEHEHYAAGSARLVVEWRGWRICPMICYDLRFPVWTRNRPVGDPGHYDLLIFVANWPARRQSHWRQLLAARAIENQACCIGLNRVGRDGNGLDYSGDSLVIAGDGELLLDCEDAAGVFTTLLDYQRLQSYRDKFPCHLDADPFDIRR